MAKRTKPARNRRPPTEKLKAVEDVTVAHRIDFSGSSTSTLLGELLEIAATMPLIRYESKRLGFVVNLDAKGKTNKLAQMNEAALGLSLLVKQIGLLMAGQDASAGYMEQHDELVNLGWSLTGLGDLTQQLLRASEQLADAEPVGDWDNAQSESEASHG